MITWQLLHELFLYEPQTGWFTNRVQRGRRGPIGERAGSFDKDGYRVIQIGGTKYRAGRMAWLYIYGSLPIEVDHWNGDRDDDSIVNLRDSTRSQNVMNADRQTGESGLRGVRYSENLRKYVARVQTGYQRTTIGWFDTAEEAHNAYLAEAEYQHGEYALHNRKEAA